MTLVVGPAPGGRVYRQSALVWVRQQPAWPEDGPGKGADIGAEACQGEGKGRRASVPACGCEGASLGRQEAWRAGLECGDGCKR